MKQNLFVILLLFLISSCYYDNNSELHPSAGLNVNCDTVNVTYTNSIAPILNTYCGTNNSCHSSGIAEGGVNFESYSSSSSVDGITLIEVIEQTGSTIMPPSGKLSDCNINLIKIWIETGKPQ